MPTAVIDGIATHYEVTGDGPPLLMFSPGGFNATPANWTSFSLYARLRLVDHLAKSYTCIMFDRRESGDSGGRVERITWADYAAQGKGLLDHLGIARAHLMGGCVGCSAVAVFAATWPDAVASMVLYSPAGGARYRITQHARFARHLSFVAERSVATAVDHALSSDQGFTQDPRVGPWVNCVRRDPAFADSYRAVDQKQYETLVAGMARTAVRQGHRAGAGTGGPAAARRPRADRAWAGRVARDIGGPLSGGVPAARAVLGHACERADRADGPGPDPSVPRLGRLSLRLPPAARARCGRPRAQAGADGDGSAAAAQRPPLLQAAVLWLQAAYRTEALTTAWSDGRPGQASPVATTVTMSQSAPSTLSATMEMIFARLLEMTSIAGRPPATPAGRRPRTSISAPDPPSAGPARSGREPVAGAQAGSCTSPVRLWLPRPCRPALVPAEAARTSPGGCRYQL